MVSLMSPPANRPVAFESNLKSNRPLIPPNTFHDGPTEYKSNRVFSNQ